MSDTAHDSPRHELYDPDPPPTSGEVQAAQEESRDLLEQSEMAAGRLEHEHVGRIATRAARKESRRYGLWGVLFAVLMSLAVSLVAVSWAAKADTTAEQASQSAQAAQHTIDAALAELAAANKQLQERGQAPVQVAPNPDPSDAIQAAVLAKVLAQLPATPTAQQVAAQLQPAVVDAVANRSVLAQLVADYLAVNKPPGPTQEQIQAAVDQRIAENPPHDGVNGRDGKDGESPPCLFESAQCRGVDGKNGADSIVPGPPPNSWTWPDPVVPAVTHTCTRSGGDDSAANYTCT